MISKPVLSEERSDETKDESGNRGSDWDRTLKLPWKEVILSHSIFFRETMSSGMHEKSETPIREQLEAEIAAFQNAIAPRLDAWLASFEGRRFESSQAALEQIRQIVHIVRNSGRRLVFQNEKVTVTVTTGQRQRIPNIQVRGRENGKGRIIQNSVCFPKLSTIPAEE
jgi:hypothetical protein